jgi:outer membrane protein assembly factor BamD
MVLAALMLAGCGGQLNLANLTVRELYDTGMDQYERERYLQAIEAFQTIVFNYPGEALVDTAQYYLGLSYFARKDYLLAQADFSRLLINYPSSVFAPQAQLMKAVCFYKGTPKHYALDQTDLETAVKQFEDFLIDYPESDAVPEARQYLAEAKNRLARKLYETGVVYVYMSDYRAARIYFQNVIDNYTETEYASNATYQMAESFFKAKDFARSHEQFENFRTVFAEHEWAAKAAERSCEAAFRSGEQALEIGDQDAARTRFERFMLVCGPDSENYDKVQKHLDQLGQAPVVEVDSAHAGS